MKAQVDPDRCAGHGDCVSTCGSVFAFHPDGYAEVTVDEIPDDAANSVREAVEQCPEHAISIDEGRT